ncbi:MAG TPA: hypothetical protein VJ824_04785 [Bacillota bacterium]|nr:hypothetical protein [Bacillota bacterium]
MNIKEMVLGFLPSGMVLIMASLTVLIPGGCYYLSKKIYSAGNPPWKRKN